MRWSRKVRRRRRLWPVVVTAACAACLALGAITMLVMLLRDDRAEQPAVIAGCGDGPTTPGIDVSYHQDTIRWPRVRKAGIRFAFIRVSDGLTFADPKFSENWDGALQARIVRGAYQFFRPEESATAQADLMIAALARDRGELPPAIDLETSGGRTPAQVATAVRTWVDRVRSRLGVEPIVYTSPELWRSLTDNADLSRQPLWVAHYTDGCPRVPPPWSAWRFWQHSKTGRVPGIDGPVDLDVFAGTADDLRRR